MKLAFTKMHGAGNDFVVIDATKVPFALSRAQLQRLARAVARRTVRGLHLAQQELLEFPDRDDYIRFKRVDADLQHQLQQIAHMARQRLQRQGFEPQGKWLERLDGRSDAPPPSAEEKSSGRGR